MAYLEPINEEWLIGKRREVHAWPEPGWAEFVSSARVIEHLTRQGFKVLCGREVINEDFIRGAKKSQIEAGLKAAKEKGVSEEILQRLNGVTGVVGILETGRPGPVIGFRCELDCVPVTETSDPEHIPNKEGFASKNPGYMHACGHDGHQAVMMGLASWLNANRDKLCGTVKLIFQPAEEGVRGARPLAESGILDDINYLYCGHLGCDIPGGEVVSAPEKFLCTTKVDFRFKGTASHAGMQPEVGRNALMAASTASLALMALPRHGSGMTRVNVGYMRAGEGRNVIPVNAKLVMEVRGETSEINSYMVEQTQNIIEGVSKSFGVDHHIEKMGEAVDLFNDKEMVDMLDDVCSKTEGVKKTLHEVNFGGSEDATILARRVQAHGGKAAYFVLGSDRTGGHHTSDFDIDESSLDIGVNIYSEMLKRLMK